MGADAGVGHGEGAAEADERESPDRGLGLRGCATQAVTREQGEEHRHEQAVRRSPDALGVLLEEPGEGGREDDRDQPQRGRDERARHREHGRAGGRGAAEPVQHQEHAAGETEHDRGSDPLCAGERAQGEAEYEEPDPQPVAALGATQAETPAPLFGQGSGVGIRGSVQGRNRRLTAGGWSAGLARAGRPG